jgi:hypothetical protein
MRFVNPQAFLPGPEPLRDDRARVAINAQNGGAPAPR